MQVFTREMLQKYMEKDWILDMLVECEHEKDKNVRTHKWLKCMDNKRMIYSIVYGDFLNNKNRKQRILDVGGGYTSLTKKMLSNSDYYLLDFMAHGGQEVIDELQQKKSFGLMKIG